MTDNSKDPLIIGGVELGCRLFTGTGKYGDDALIPDIIAASGCEVVTVALRRVDLGNPNDNILSHIPAGVRLLPNTSGARDADEAVRIARLARAAGCGDWIKIEVISDSRHLLPDGYATARATGNSGQRRVHRTALYQCRSVCRPGSRERGGLRRHASGCAHRQ